VITDKSARADRLARLAHAGAQARLVARAWVDDAFGNAYPERACGALGSGSAGRARRALGL
jgi:hypothetical protein